jgi:arylsulfatase A-like enzyme
MLSRFLKFSTPLLIVVLLIVAFKPNEKNTGIKRPNIIVILADDLSKYDVSMYGGMHLNTPNMDAIGMNGVMFNQGYSTSSVCAPSRAGLLTGKYQQRFGFEFQPHRIYPRNAIVRSFYSRKFDKDIWTINRNDELPSRPEARNEGMPENEITMAEFFKSQGYATGMCGKWHLGYKAPKLPLQNGFDFHYGFYEAFTLYSTRKDSNIVDSHHEEFTDKYIWHKGRKGASAIVLNGKEINEDEYLTFSIAKYANKFIEQHKQEPFFLYIPFSAPHTPFQAPKEYYDRFASEPDHNKRVYYAMISALDDAIGKILQKVRDEGLEENTMIFFASDNGGATYTLAADNAPLKGGKFSLFEGGVNIPFAMQWKGHLPAGKVYNQSVSLMDIFPTAVGAAGFSENGIPFDGKNLLPYLKDDKNDPPHESVFWRQGFNRAMRQGNWKLLVDDKNKLIDLYDLSTDIGEKYNLKDQYADVLHRMLNELDVWDGQLNKPSWPHVMDYKVRIDGAVYEFAI